VSDAFDNKIRKITSSAVVTTLAGSGKQATVDGLGVAASFNYPFDLAVSANGEIYTVDYTNSNVRKITPEGLVSTFAGTGSSGAIDGIGTAASFYKPQGIAVDSSGIIYIADSLNNKIRKITSDGSVTTFAGSNSVSGSVDGIATAASFSTPVGITVDKKGNIYVADVYLRKIRKITSVGLVTTIAGSGTSGFNDGLAITASFRGPGGLTADDNGNIYVADTYNSRIRKINSEGVVTTIAGAGSEGFADGSGISAMFYYPQGIVLDSKGNIFIADSGNSRIRRITLQ
jgi:sugar lactone lactonase YvrE